MDELYLSGVANEDGPGQEEAGMVAELERQRQVRSAVQQREVEEARREAAALALQSGWRGKEARQMLSSTGNSRTWRLLALKRSSAGSK